VSRGAAGDHAGRQLPPPAAARPVPRSARGPVQELDHLRLRFSILQPSHPAMFAGATIARRGAEGAAAAVERRPRQLVQPDAAGRGQPAASRAARVP
jgi:hypothetical protein